MNIFLLYICKKYNNVIFIGKLLFKNSYYLIYQFQFIIRKYFVLYNFTMKLMELKLKNINTYSIWF